MRISSVLCLCAGLFLMVSIQCTTDDLPPSFEGIIQDEVVLGLETEDPGPINSEVDTGFTLTWNLTGNDTTNKTAVVYRVFVGTDSGSMQVKNPSGTAAESLHIAGLSFSTTYYWQVTAVKGSDTAVSHVWTFTTRRQPLQVAGWKIIDKHGSRMTDNEVTAMVADTSGDMWVGTRNGGLFRFRSDAVLRSYASGTSPMPACAVYSLACDRRDSVWVGTASAGLFVLQKVNRDSVKWTNFSYKPSLDSNMFTSNSIHSLAVDSGGGNIIIGSATGNRLLVPLPLPGRWKRPDSSAMCRAAPSGQPWSLAWVDINQFWVASGDGLWQGSVAIKRGTKFVVDSTGTRLDSMQVDSINTAVDPPETLQVWQKFSVKIYDTTYHHYDTTQIVAAHGSDSPALAGGINGIALDQQGRLWVATAEHGVVRFDGTQWTEYHAWSGTAMQSDVVLSIAVDKTNRVWIGTDKGIVIYDNP